MNWYIFLGIDLVIVVALIIYITAIHNQLVKKRNQVEEAFATMDVYLEKRWNLIPNLLELVKGQTGIDPDIYNGFTVLNNHSYSSMSANDKIVANEQLVAGVDKVLAIANNSSLKSNAVFQKVCAEIAQAETEITNSKKYYNAVVKIYNNSVEAVPNNIVAAIFNFEKKEDFS